MKKLVCLMLVVSFAFAVVGCNGDEGGAPTTANSTKVAPVVGGSTKTSGNKPGNDVKIELNANSDPNRFAPGSALKGGK